MDDNTERVTTNGAVPSQRVNSSQGQCHKGLSGWSAQMLRVNACASPAAPRVRSSKRSVSSWNKAVWRWRPQRAKSFAVACCHAWAKPRAGGLKKPRASPCCDSSTKGYPFDAARSNRSASAPFSAQSIANNPPSLHDLLLSSDALANFLNRAQSGVTRIKTLGIKAAHLCGVAQYHRSGVGYGPKLERSCDF